LYCTELRHMINSHFCIQRALWNSRLFFLGIPALNAVAELRLN